MRFEDLRIKDLKRKDKRIRPPVSHMKDLNAQIVAQKIISLL